MPFSPSSCSSPKKRLSTLGRSICGRSSWCTMLSVPKRGRMTPRRAVVPSGRLSRVRLASSTSTLRLRSEGSRPADSSPAESRTTALAYGSTRPKRPSSTSRGKKRFSRPAKVPSRRRSRFREVKSVTKSPLTPMSKSSVRPGWASANGWRGVSISRSDGSPPAGAGAGGGERDGVAREPAGRRSRRAPGRDEAGVAVRRWVSSCSRRSVSSRSRCSYCSRIESSWRRTAVELLADRVHILRVGGGRQARSPATAGGTGTATSRTMCARMDALRERTVSGRGGPRGTAGQVRRSAVRLAAGLEGCRVRSARRPA